MAGVNKSILLDALAPWRLWLGLLDEELARRVLNLLNIIGLAIFISVNLVSDTRSSVRRLLHLLNSPRSILC